MVRSVTNLGRSGLADWLIQRVSALIMATYIAFLLFYLIAHSPMDFVTWKHLFSTSAMRIFSLLALLSMLWHAWVGLWTIATDYLTTRALGCKGVILRIMFQSIVMLALFVNGVWGIQILWGLQ